MWIFLSYLLISIIMPMVMGMGSFLVSSKFMSNDSFECGFDSFNVSVFPVSLRFFMFCIIFLILDLELIIMSLIPLIMWTSGFIFNLIMFLIMVTISMMVEWLFGSLSWME